MAISTATSFSQGLGPLALAPMFPQLMETFNSDLAGVVQFTGICILVLGFSNFFWCVMLIVNLAILSLPLSDTGFPYKPLTVDDLS